MSQAGAAAACLARPFRPGADHECRLLHADGPAGQHRQLVLLRRLPLLCFADGRFGYSWRFLDLGTSTINPIGGVLAGTWPFLSCVVSCSGTILQVDGQGMTDAIDQYCPVGSLRTTFTFGTTSGSFTSMAMAIEEVVDKVGTVSAKNAAVFPNPDILMSDVATVGCPWTATLTLGVPRNKAGNWVLFFGAVKINPPNGIPQAQFSAGLNFGVNKAGRMLLCAFDPFGFSITTIHDGIVGNSSTSNPGAGIPKRLGPVCNVWCAQAVVLGPVPAAFGSGNARLSSMVHGIVGSTKP